MSEIVHLTKSPSHSASQGAVPSNLETKQAFRNFLRRIEQDPDRDGQLSTPNRLVRALQKYFVPTLERIVEAYARRLQIQERLSAQLANVIEFLKLQDAAIVDKGEHQSSRCLHIGRTYMVTSRMLGRFHGDAARVNVDGPFRLGK